MKKEPRWISKRVVLAIHERLLAEHGGAPGLVSEPLLDSALESPRNHFAYGRASDVFELAAAYAHALTQDHPFVDGNKRIALTVALTFLERNGLVVSAPETEAVEIVIGLSSRDLDARVFAEWLRQHSKAPRRRKPIAGRPRIRAVVKKRK